MTNLDSFLADLDQWSDSDSDEESVNEDNADQRNMDGADLDDISHLQTSQRFSDTMQKIDSALEHGSLLLEEDDIDPRYDLILDCNALFLDIDNEIGIIHNFIRDKYRSKFPELETLIPHPIDYALVVKRIGNETDLTLVDFEGLLPSAMIMVVSVAASTTRGKQLSEQVLKKTIEACDRVIALSSARKKIVELLGFRMGRIAPNLCALVGSEVAAKLIASAGGLSALANMPACNVQLLGAKRGTTVAGLRRQSRVGYVEQTEIFQCTPPSLRTRAAKLLVAKLTLVARLDFASRDPNGEMGRALCEEIRSKIEKLQELPTARQPKPLPVPDSNPKTKRGGRRLTKRKERYGMTDVRKLANRMQFGIPEESSLGDGYGVGYGMLGQSGNGKLRVPIAAKVMKMVKQKHSYGRSTAATTTTSGLASSLAFTPVQGIELSNPQSVAYQLGGGKQSTYFSDIGMFTKIKKT